MESRRSLSEFLEGISVPAISIYFLYFSLEKTQG
jgi:hypothetical protein